jgi:preprotein translocase subunit SecD
MPAKEKEQEEYELIAVSPLRRLEKRIDQLETVSPAIDLKEVFKEVVDIVRMNQQLVDELIKANDSLRIELAKLPSRMEELINNLNELISFIKASAGEEAAPYYVESFKPLADKLDVLIETNKKIIENNQAVLSALGEIDKKLKRPSPPPMPIRRPMLPPRTL